MRSDFNNPFAAPPERHFICGDKVLVEIQLKLLAHFAEIWLDRVENAWTPLTAAFNRFCRGKMFRAMLLGAETDLGITPPPDASPEKRLAAVAETATAKGFALKDWEKILPQIAAVSAEADCQTGVAAAKATRAALRKARPAGK